ncbi:sigma-70 family RNA polymerase sigma factor [Streptomyces olivoverticillatus]
MYPHVGVDASGLATLRAAVLDRLRVFVPTAYAVPALATLAPAAAVGPVGPCYALAESSAAVGRRTRRGAGAATSTTARRPSADSDSARMLDLVERAQAGEAEAFGRLYDQYADTVYRYIYYRVGGRATAEDLTSETFLRALRRIGTFTWQGRDFGAWLVTIARNLVADHFKSSRFRLEVTTGEMLDANEVERSPEDSVLESLSNAALLEAVRKLNPPSSRSASRCASSRACRSPRPPA